MKNFYLAAKTIHELNLNSNAIVVYYDLCRRANQEDQCWPAKKTVANACSISVSTVTRSLRELERAGMIATVERFEVKKDHSRTYKRQTSNVYIIFATPHKFTQPNKMDVQPAKPEQQEILEVSDTPVIQEIHEENNQSVVTLPETAPKSILSLSKNETQNYAPADQSCPEEPTEAMPCVSESDSRKSTKILSSMGLLCFLFSFFDTPPRVTVIPHGTTSQMKVTDNLRVKSLFSKLAKRNIGRSPHFFAGLSKCLSKSE